MEFQINLWGDLALQHPLSGCEADGFRALREVLRGAELTVANLEGSIQNGEDWPAQGILHLDAGPWVAEELLELGMRVVYTANNKAADFGAGGVLTTLKYLDQAGVAHAGSGPSLTEATAPTYIATRLGRVAILAAADNGSRGLGSSADPVMPAGNIAADGSPFYRSRPGVNMVRYDTTFHVDREAFDALRRASQLLRWDEERSATRWRSAVSAEPDDVLDFRGAKFQADDTFGFTTSASRVDLERNCKWIREARRNAELVIVGFHQNGAVWRADGLHGADDPPADHTMEFAHLAIDAGADVVHVHGAGHGGIEFYKGKAIIYGSAGYNPHHARVRVPPEEFEALGLSMSHTPADLTAAMTKGREQAEDSVRTLDGGPSSYSGGSVVPIGGRDILHTVVLNSDLTIRTVLVRPICVKRGSWGGAGTPVLASPDEDIHRHIVNAFQHACEGFGSAVEHRDGLAAVTPRSRP